MKLTRNMHKHITGVALIVLLVGLPGCVGWFTGEKEAGVGKGVTPSGKEVKEGGVGEVPVGAEGEILVTMDGKPLITVEGLEREKKDLMESNPQLKAVFAFMPPKQLDRNLAEGLTNQAVVDRYVTDHKIDQTKEYQQEMERAIHSFKHMLGAKFFSQQLKVEVTDAEAKEYYEKHKDSIPKLLLSHGGVKAMGVSFDTQEKAQAFLAKVNESKGNLQKAADAAGLKDKVQDFHLVNDQSIGLDAQLRDKIVAIKKMPSVEIIKGGDNNFWVVQATEKQETKYQPFELVKTDLIKYLEQEKRSEMLEKEIEKLRTKYNIAFKEEYFAHEDNKGEEPSKEELATDTED